MKETDISKIKADIEKYEREVESLESLKTCSDVGNLAEKYIDKHILVLKKHIFDLHTRIDFLERD
ncbi:MAG: hypothetical protein MJ204_00865 [Bacteroidales bacterium]|nr:hypothetical protein [Bacteroidales bacterium]